METKKRLARDEADLLARQVAALGAAYEDQGKDSSSARRDLLFLLLAQDIEIVPDVMSKISTRLHVRIRDDVEYRLLHALEMALVGPATSQRQLADLHSLSTTSPIGWAIGYLNGCVTHAVSNARRDARVIVELDDDEQLGAVRMQLMIASPPPEEFLHLESERLRRDSVESGLEEIKGARGLTHLHRAVRMFHSVFGIPDVRAPRSRAARDHLLTAITLSPALVAESLVEAAQCSVEEREHMLSGLWIGFSSEDALSLLERHHEVATVIVRSALSPRPRPSREHLALLRRSIRAASSNSSWHAVSGELVEAWLAEFYAAKSDHDNTATHSRPARVARPATDRWLSIAVAAARFPGRPLGVLNHPVEVDHVLRHSLRELAEA